MKRYLTLLIASLLHVMAFSSTYYCSPDGGGDGNSLSSPSTFDEAFSRLKGGDTLLCKSGVYYRDNRITIGSGKQGYAERRTLIAAAEGEKPIFDFSKEPYGERGFVISSGVQYVHLRGLVARYTGKNAIYNQGSYCLFENLEAYGNGDTGIQMKGGGYNTILNCDSHDNFDYQTTSGTAINYGGNADGFADKQFTGGPNHYIGCRAWNNSDDGWDFFQRVTSGGPNILENCICYQSGPVEYNLSNNPRVQTDYATWFNSFPKAVTDRYGRNVTATIEHYPNIGNGNGFKIGGERTLNDIKLINCLAVGCAYRGFDQNNNGGAMTVYNCTGYDNNPNYGFPGANSSSLDIKNCISFSSRQSDNFNIPLLTSDHNSWNTAGVTCDKQDFASLDTAAYILAPRNSDFSLPTTPLLRLQETSDMIDAGVKVGLPYSGSAPDLGCYEFGDALYYPGTLSVTKGPQEQTIVAGNDIAPVTLTWGGGAVGVTIDETIPDGIVINIDQNAKTVTVQGSIGIMGIYSITLTTQVESDVDAEAVTLTFYVKSASAKRIAYLTIPNSAADRPILDKLNNDLNFNVSIVDASNAVNSLSDFELLLISSVPSSTAAGMMSVKGAPLPTMLLKPFQLKSTAWNWGNAVNTQDHDINVVQPGHPIFSGINITDGKATLFTAHDRNAVTAIDNWFHNTTVNVLATAASGEQLQAVVEIGAGTEIDGTTLSHKLLMIGVSEYSTINLSTDGTQLIHNACQYLLGQNINTALTENKDDIAVERTAHSLSVNSSTPITSIKLFTPDGLTVAHSRNGIIITDLMPAGVYIIVITTANGNTTARKIIL